MTRLTRRLGRSLLWLLVPAAAACGYSEDEWRAQLDKYGQLEKRYEAEQRTAAATKASLDEQTARVAELESQLERMGVNLKSLNAKLEADSTEKARLAANLDELRRAVDEFKGRAEALERIKQRFEVLRGKLQKLTTLGLTVAIRNNRMVISLPGDVLFASGSDKLRDEGVAVLDQVATVVRADDQLSKRYFQVAGHTDNVPLKGSRFSDNWGLSAMRAREVLVHLVEPVDAGGGGLDAARLHAAGYGETDPLGENTTPQGRQQNRRVELVLMPDVEEMLDLRTLL